MAIMHYKFISSSRSLPAKILDKNRGVIGGGGPDDRETEKKVY